ncbi:MAG: hypothetical protein ABIY50_07335 [Ignavibacteria bacterium]
MKKIYLIFFIAISAFMIGSCGKKEEPQTFVPPSQQSSVDRDKEKNDREEFERLKKLQNGGPDSASASDSSITNSDTLFLVKSDSTKKLTEKKKLVQKEKELNKRLDNPKTTITDYIELIQRGTSEGGNFEQNMKRASDLWEVGNVNRFKTNYKNTKKFIILEEPKVISQKGNAATVEVKIKKVDGKNNINEEVEMTVKYNMIADSKGKWKIKNNTVIKK